LPIPDPGVRFDIIIGHSVITHVSKAETLEYVHRLLGFLTADGRAAFSFNDPSWTPPPGWAPGLESVSNLHERLLARQAVNPDVDVAGLLGRAARQAELTWVTLVNDDELYFDPDEDGLSGDKPSYDYTTFCTPEYMRRLFPSARIVDPVSPLPLHCLVLDRTGMA
jgi:hypothetical protein